MSSQYIDFRIGKSWKNIVHAKGVDGVEAGIEGMLFRSGILDGSFFRS